VRLYERTILVESSRVDPQHASRYLGVDDVQPEEVMKLVIAAMVVGLALLPPAPADAQQAGRVTILYDAFGGPSALQKDWGFAALVEYGGRRVLFDTGNDAAIFARNVKQLGVDLSRLDAAVISHRHGDHTTGLEVLIATNPKVAIYVPREGAFFKGAVPMEFLAPDPTLPPNMRYFDGNPPGGLRGGTPWPRAIFRSSPRPQRSCRASSY
jgi:7,8-dihydropterin-6-yl-methyl-4-(beta-D-ribofuranosyl)aminobenzene 5'-phosphate synthase